MNSSNENTLFFLTRVIILCAVCAFRGGSCASTSIVLWCLCFPHAYTCLLVRMLLLVFSYLNASDAHEFEKA